MRKADSPCQRERRHVQRRRRALALGLLVSINIALIPSVAALGDVILLHGGGKLEGDVIEATDNIISIRRSAGGMQQITRKMIAEIIVELEGGGEIRGEFVQWVNGIHHIRSDGHIVRLRAGEVLSRDEEALGLIEEATSETGASSRSSKSPVSNQRSYVPPTIYVLNNGTTFVGRVIDFDDTLLTIRRAAGGQQILRAEDLKEVVIRGSDGSTISGEFIDWSEGAFELRADDRLVRVTQGKIVNEAIGSSEIGGPLENLPKPASEDSVMVADAMTRVPASEQLADVADSDLSASDIDSSTIALSTSVESVSEQDGAATFDLRLSRPAPRTIVVIYSVINETADDEDYRNGNGILTIEAGLETGQIVIPVIDDTIQEGDESFLLYLSGDPKLIDVKPNRIAAVIKDND